jgi:hypothetical protein
MCEPHRTNRFTVAALPSSRVQELVRPVGYSSLNHEAVKVPLSSTLSLPTPLVVICSENKS